MSDSGTNYQRLPTFGADGIVHLVIEAPQGARAKLKFEPGPRAFFFSRPMPLGLAYPFDWGFVPSTLAEDGDLLDGFVLHGAATWPGTVFRCRPLGALAVEQTENGRTQRNDRLAFCPDNDPRDECDLLNERARRELEQFFMASVFGMGKELRFPGWKSTDHALALVKSAAQAFARNGPVA